MATMSLYRTDPENNIWALIPERIAEKDRTGEIISVGLEKIKTVTADLFDGSVHVGVATINLT